MQFTIVYVIAKLQPGNLHTSGLRQTAGCIHPESKLIKKQGFGSGC